MEINGKLSKLKLRQLAIVDDVVLNQGDLASYEAVLLAGLSLEGRDRLYVVLGILENAN
jgi:hypothetical protein